MLPFRKPEALLKLPISAVVIVGVTGAETCKTLAPFGLTLAVAPSKENATLLRPMLELNAVVV